MKIKFDKLSSIIFLIFALLLSTSPVFAQETVIDGIAFSVKKISYGQWSKPRQHLINDMIDHIDQNGEALSYIAIAYVLVNYTNSRKLDLDGKFQYQLADEFGNRYRLMRKPDDYKSPVLTVSKNFPSLYPGEQYGETLFFEAPISSAKNLKLGIISDDLKLSKPVELKIPLGTPIQQVSTTSVTKDPDQLTKPINMAKPFTIGGVPSRIKIVSPGNGVVWDQGQSARIVVSYMDHRIPKKVIVIAFDNTFQDYAPVAENIYDINVPSDCAPGVYTLNLIAESTNGEISSALLTFYVKDATPLAIF
ncbi:MAG: hypothetical protein HQL22_04235 [Candidatus Omnitrophica bacterium]|nr:hypothetical protein [Candidatus Omnitrophota bacterium]